VASGESDQVLGEAAESVGVRGRASGAQAMAYVGSRTTRDRNARGDGLRVYAIDESCWRHEQTVETLPNPSFLVMNAARNVLYTVHGDLGQVSAFAIGADGHLRLLNAADTGGRNPVHLTVDESGRFLLVANYATGNVGVLPILQDGSLGPLCDLLQLSGAPGPHRTEQTGSHPHQVVADPTGSHFIVPDKGLDKVFILQLDSDRRRLSIEFAVPAVREGSGPRHAAFHPLGATLYVANELDSTVTTFRRDKSRGLVPIEVHPTVSPDCLKTSRAAAIAISTSARWVFVSNRGDDSIASCRVDEQDCTLRPERWTTSGGTTPRFIGFDARRSGLLVANETSDSIIEFALDETTGKLTQTGDPIATGSPVCVVISDGSTQSLSVQET
jgi:6-phosphogluconolactonase (cycloisomerase 2 family)